MRKIITIILALVLLGYVSLAYASHQHTLNRGQQSQDTLITVVDATAGPGALGQEGAGQRGSALTLVQNMRQGVFVLKITDTPLSGTLNVLIQSSPDSGNTWIDIAAFEQMTTVGRRLLFWNSYTMNTDVDIVASAPTDGTLAASTVYNIPIGNQLRVAYIATGPTPAWDFTVESFLRE